MKKAIVLILITSANLFTSCASSKVLTSCIGYTKTELYLKLGKPTSVNSDGHGGQIIIYDSTTIIESSPDVVYDKNYTGVSYTTSHNTSYTRGRIFFINADSIVYSSIKL